MTSPVLPKSLSSPDIINSARFLYCHLDVTCTSQGIQPHLPSVSRWYGENAHLYNRWFSAPGMCNADSLLLIPLNDFWVVFYPLVILVTHRAPPFSTVQTVLLLLCWICFSTKTRDHGASSLAETSFLLSFIYSCLNHTVIALFLLCSTHYAGSAVC